MNWKKLYREPRVGTRVELITDDTPYDDYKKGDTFTIVNIKITKPTNKKTGTEYYVTSVNYLFRNEFKVIG